MSLSQEEERAEEEDTLEIHLDLVLLVQELERDWRLGHMSQVLSW